MKRLCLLCLLASACDEDECELVPLGTADGNRYAACVETWPCDEEPGADAILVASWTGEPRWSPLLVEVVPDPYVTGVTIDAVDLVEGGDVLHERTSAEAALRWIVPDPGVDLVVVDVRATCRGDGQRSFRATVSTADTPRETYDGTVPAPADTR